MKEQQSLTGESILDRSKHCYSTAHPPSPMALKVSRAKRSTSLHRRTDLMRYDWATYFSYLRGADDRILTASRSRTPFHTHPFPITYTWLIINSREHQSAFIHSRDAPLLKMITASLHSSHFSHNYLFFRFWDLFIPCFDTKRDILLDRCPPSPSATVFNRRYVQHSKIPSGAVAIRPLDNNAVVWLDVRWCNPGKNPKVLAYTFRHGW